MNKAQKEFDKRIIESIARGTCKTTEVSVCVSMKVKGFEPTEHQIQADCIGYLRIKGYYVQRMNSGNYAVGEGANRRHIVGARAGTPDIFALKDGKCTFWEVKRPKKHPTPLQTVVMNELEEFGAKCYVIHSLEELMEVIG